jgi:hypothetical protein
MKRRPVALILHPKDWCSGKYKGKYDYHHVSIGGEFPKKRNGVITRDGYADMGTDEGKTEVRKAFQKYKPDIFLWWIHGNLGLVDLLPWKMISPKTKFVMWFGNHRHKAPGNVTNVKRVLDMVLLNSKDKEHYKVISPILGKITSWTFRVVRSDLILSWDWPNVSTYPLEQDILSLGPLLQDLKSIIRSTHNF